MRKKTIYLFVLGLAVVVMTAIVSAGLVVSAQNTNSSTTMAPASKPKTKRRSAPKMSRCDPMQQEQTDLSGTYTGKINFPEGGMTGEATLTITGNNWTMTAGSETHSGRITAVTTCGYTGVTMMSGDLTPPPPSPNPPAARPAVSLRAKKVGDRMTLTSVPGEKRMFSFSTGGGMMKKAGSSRRRSTKPPPPPAP